MSARRAPTDTPEAVELLACPYCGGIASLDPMPGSRGWWRVRCKGYECGGTTWAMPDEERAVAAWNRRPQGGKA